MLIKIQDGTPKSGPSLCASCNNCTHIKGDSFTQVLTYCNVLYPNVNIAFPVVSCSDYSNKKDTKLKDMEKVAWVIAGKGRAAGFVTPDRWKEDHPDESPSKL